MKIFDSHLHIEQGLDKYDLEVIKKNIIFNSISSYQQRHQNLSRDDCISLIFDYKNNFDFIISEIKQDKISALKIHSRFQKIANEDYDLLIEKLSLMPETLPVIIDAFYFGDELEYQPSLGGIIKIVKAFPQRTFIIAHCGGYKTLVYFFHLRKLENICYELSFSLQYLSDTSVFGDLKKLIKYTDKNRIIYGSDHPYASPAYEFDLLNDIAKELKLTLEEREKIYYYNALEIFKQAENGLAD